MKYDGESMTKWGENNPNTFPNPRGGQKNTKKKKPHKDFIWLIITSGQIDRSKWIG